MKKFTGKRRKFLLLILILFILCILLAVGIFLGVRSLKKAVANAGLSNALTIKSEEFPTVDGTYFMQAYGEATRSLLTGESIIVSREYVLFTGPDSAKERLLNGEADILILSENDSIDVVEKAKEQGIDLVYYPIAHDGRVIYCDESNELNDITPEEYQNYKDTTPDGLGFTTYCYWLSSWSSSGTKLLSVNGVTPSERTIATDEYFNTYSICVVYRDGGIASNVQRVVAWMLGEEGQETLKNLGYINNIGSEIAEGAGANAYTYYATRNETSLESTGIRVIKGSDGNDVTEGTTTNYLIQNPIVWTSVKKDKGTIGEISGLVNTTVQNAINERILSAYEELAALDIPEFRGIRLTIPAESILINTKITATVLYNYNNVLSIRMQGDYTYALPDETGNIRENAWGYYETTKVHSCSDYLNFDLNTGREISLENVFINDCDYRDFVSSKIVSDSVFSSSFIMSGSYKLVRTDQKFYLQGDCLYLVFDQDSPEYILTNPQETIIKIYYSEMSSYLAITARYYDEETSSSLYSSGTKASKVLIPNRDELDINETETATYDTVTVTRSWSYASTLSSYAKNRILNAAKTNSTVLSALKKTGKQATYSISTVATRQNNYLSITTTDKRWVEGETDTTYTYYECYDIDSLTEAKLSDLFWAGFDYQSVICSALREEIALKGGLYKTVKKETVALTTEETEAQIQSIVSELTTFAIDNSRLYVSVNSIQLESGTSCISVQIPFSSFGSENMTIFQ